MNFVENCKWFCVLLGGFFLVCYGFEIYFNSNRFIITEVIIQLKNLVTCISVVVMVVIINMLSPIMKWNGSILYKQLLIVVKENFSNRDALSYLRRFGNTNRINTHFGVKLNSRHHLVRVGLSLR